jgi:hypothetical protein
MKVYLQINVMAWTHTTVLNSNNSVSITFTKQMQDFMSWTFWQVKWLCIMAKKRFSREDVIHSHHYTTVISLLTQPFVSVYKYTTNQIKYLTAISSM